MEFLNVCNKYGENTGEVIERNIAHSTGALHRVIQLWIINSNNEILIQQRSLNKESGANLWYVSVGGHIDADENIENTLIRETKEELGLDISLYLDSIEYLFTFKDNLILNNNAYFDNEFYDVFVLKADFKISEITIQKEEVQAVKYISYDDFENIVITEDKTFLHHKKGYQYLLLALKDILNR